MTFYFGRASAGLVALPPPGKGLTPTLERQSTVHESSSGGRVVDLASRTRRTFALSWTDLDPAALSTLEEFFTGARGPGPFVLLDPGRRNYLTPNQSGATSQSNDGTGFQVSAGSGEAVSSASAPVLRGPRSLRWSLPATVTSGVLDLTPPAGLIGFPTPAGTPWTWSGQISSAGLAASVTVTPALSWVRADGSEVAATLGTPVAATPAGWAAWSVSLATPPAGAVYVRPQLRVATGVLVTGGFGGDVVDMIGQPRRGSGHLGAVAIGGRVLVVAPRPARWGTGGLTLIEAGPSSATALLVDQLQLDMSATARTWVVGTGVPLVSFTALGETYTTLPQRNVVATMVEVG